MSLPSGYKQIEYVDSNGTGSYFKTGIFPAANTRVVFDGYVISGDTALYGSRYNNSDNRYAVQYIGTNVYRLGYVTSESAAASTYSAGTRYTFDQKDGQLYINDTLVATVSLTANFPNAQEIYAVGALNTKGKATNLGVVRMYGMKFYQNDTLVGDFIPVKDPSGNIGIFNDVTQVFYGNSGTGSVAAGPDVVTVTVVSIAVTTPPAKVAYEYGEELDTTGMVVTAAHDDGTSAEITGYEVSGYNAELAGEQTVTVTYEGCTAAFGVTVAEAVPHTVTFVDWDGTVLKTERMNYGEAATAPDAPVRKFYVFSGWDKDFSYIKTDLTVTAQYTSNYREYTLGENVTGKLDLGTYELVVSGSGAMTNFTSITRPARTDTDFAKIAKCTILNGVTSIGTYAFYSCSNLKSIIIPSRVTSIGKDAFFKCTALTSITIPDSVTSIGDNAFSYCSALASITMPDIVASIGDYAFSDCSALTSVVIPDSVTKIGNYVFCYCSALASVTIPDGVTSIGDYAFSGCYNLTSVAIPNCVASIGDYAFFKCTALTSITIPDSVTSIGNYVFCDCTALASVTIPDGVTSIGDNAFSGCYNLTSVTIPNSVTIIGYKAFYNCSKLKSIIIPDGVKDIGNYAFWWCSALTSVVIPDSVTSIGEDAFYVCSKLTSITILNHEVTIFDSSNTIYSGATIYGYKDSTAEAYATKYSRTFVPLDQPTNHTVTFTNWNGDILKTEEVDNGASATPPDNPSREGYFFLGWDKDFLNVTSDLTVTATYDPVATISLLPTTLNLFEAQTGTLTYMLSPDTLTKAAVTWANSSPDIASYDSSTGVVTALKAGTTTITVTHISQGVEASCEVTVTADTVESISVATMPNKTEYTVGYNFDAVGLSVSATYASGKVVTLTDGFELSGFDSASAGTKTITVTYCGRTTTFDVEVMETMPTYQVRFMDWDGTVLKTQEVQQGGDATPPYVPDRVGYTFLSWDVDYSKVKSDITVTAIYSVIQLKVTWMYENRYSDDSIFDSGTEKTEMVNYGEDATPPNSQQFGPSTFEGYDKPYTNITEDTTITIICRMNVYTITFTDENGGLLGSEDVEHGKSITYPDYGKKYLRTIWQGPTTAYSTETVQCILVNALSAAIVLKNLPDKTVYTVGEEFDKTGIVLEITYYSEEVKGNVTVDEADASLYTIDFDSSTVGLVGFQLDFSPYGTKLGSCGYGPITIAATVLFLDWNGTELSKQIVNPGEAAVAPTDPVRDGYFFLGWDTDFTNVTADLTITATYDYAAQLTLAPSEVWIVEGDTASLELIIKPDALVDQKVTWTNSNPVSVDFDSSTGIITGLRLGTSIITAIHNRQQIDASCLVTVVASSEMSDAYKEAIRTNSRGEWDCQVTVDGANIPKPDINNLKLTEIQFDSDKISIGSVVSSYVEIEFRNTGKKFLNKPLTFKIGMLVADAFEYVRFGTFHVTDSEGGEEDETITVTAYDAVKKTDVSYKSALAYPSTIQAVAEEIATICGVPLATTEWPEITITSVIKADTCRNALSVLAQLMGCCVVANRKSQLEFRWFRHTDIVIDAANRYYTFSRKDMDSYIRSVKMVNDNGTFTAISSQAFTEEVNGLDVSAINTYGTQEIVDSIMAKMELTYRAGEVDFVGDPSMAVGDVITVQDKAGKSFVFPIMKNTLEYDGGVQNTMDAYTESEEEKEFTSSKKTTEEKLDEVVSSVDDIENDLYGEYDEDSGEYTGGIVDLVMGTVNPETGEMTGGMLKCVSVAELPATTEGNTIYLIQGEVTVN